MKRALGVVIGIATATAVMALALWWPDRAVGQFYQWPYPSIQTLSSGSILMQGTSPTGASAVGVILDNVPALTTSGSKIVSFRNNTTEKAYVDKDGNFYTGGNYLLSSSTLQLSPNGGSGAAFQFQTGGVFSVLNSTGTVVQANATDGASAVGIGVKQYTAFTTAGAKLSTWLNGTTEEFAIDKDGALVFAQKCDSTGSPGSATCNQAAGRAAISTGTKTITITNSLVAATSIIMATLQTTDATCLGVQSVVPGAGSFTINTAANCTANSNVAWVITGK